MIDSTSFAPFVVFRLRTTTAAKTIDSSTSVFALSSLDTDESVEAAHERDMVQWRESVDEKRFQQATVSAIAPSEKLKDAENAIAVSRTRGIGGEDSSLSSSSTPLVRPGKPNAKAKAMTAASFFGGHKAQNKANKVVQKKTVQKSTEKKKEISKPVKKVQANPSKIGNADDFQADEEESDDEEVVRVVPKRQPVRLQKVAPAPKEVEIKSSPVRGAMDAFCNDEEKPNNQRRRKRRKKLVEKTSMVGGYLRTETVTLWEDIPTDEENDEIEKKKIARSKPTGAVSKSKNSQNMKQKSLMGFFAKK
jgi:hypothetical protein